MKILFCCSDSYGIYKIIEKGIHHNLECELKTIVFGNFRYKNIFYKIKNFFFKVFLNKNLKKEWASKEWVSTINENDFFDYLFIISPELLTIKDLEFLKQRSKHSIVYFWDSINNISAYKNMLPYFDSIYSFEPRDVKKYNLKFLTNFYHNTNSQIQNEFDAFFIGGYDSKDRITKVLKILTYLESQKKKNKFYICTKKDKIINKYKKYNLIFIKHPIPVQESEKISQNCSIIIDIQQKVQNGLTFRVFEAMGHHKKLITTNEDIINYDFYNPSNIFVWNDKTTEIPDSFFDTPYEELPQEIFTKYSLKTWVQTIFK